MPIIIAPQMPDLPADLQRSGWTHSLRDSRELRHPSGIVCETVYFRDFDPCRDDRLKTNVREEGRVVISTRAKSWDEAHAQAIDDMRYVDEQRRAS